MLSDLVFPSTVGRKQKNSTPLRSTSGGETRIPCPMSVCNRTDTTVTKSTRKTQKPMHSESSVAQVKSAAIVATGTSIPLQNVVLLASHNKLYVG